MATCGYCGLKVNSHFNLKRHIQRYHKQRNPQPSYQARPDPQQEDIRNLDLPNDINTPEYREMVKDICYGYDKTMKMNEELKRANEELHNALAQRGGGNEESDQEPEPDESEKTGDIFDDDDDSTMDDGEYDSDKDDEITDELMGEVYDDMEEEKQTLVENLEQQVSDEEEDLDSLAHDKLLPKYRKLFRQKVIDELIRIDKFRREPLYRNVMKTAKGLHDYDGMKREESIRAAVSKRKHALNMLLDTFEDQGQEDEEYDADSEEQESGEESETE